MLWIFLIFLPFFGWLALIGYNKKIIRELILGQRKELPAFGSFWKNFKAGLIIFIFLIPTMIVSVIISMVPFVGSLLNLFVNIFFLPWLIMNFMVKGTFDSLWEIEKCYKTVFGHAEDFLWAYLKTLVYVFIYGFLSFFLVGLPAYLFGGNFFLTEFYRKHK